MVGLRFNSIGVSDGISNGTDGMAYSLQSRDLIADGIETVMGAQFYDANISVPCPCREARPTLPASAAQAADWPRLAEAPGSLRRALALTEASGEPAGRRLSPLVFDRRRCPAATRTCPAA